MRFQVRLRYLRLNARLAVSIFVGGFLSLSWLSGLSPAQAPAGFTWEKIDPIYTDYRKLNPQKMIKTSVLLGQQNLATNQTVIENWYRKYVFAAMSSQEHLGDSSALREDVAKDLRNARGATHQFLLDLVYDEATTRVTGNYHPAVRYNGMLIVGNLNQTEARIVGSDRYPPVRFAKAFDFMLEQLKASGQMDVLRLGAMIGIERHLELVRQRPQDQPIPDAKRAEVASLMLSLLTEKAPPANRSVDGHTWMRRRAVKVLATMGAVGDNQSVLQSLATIVGDTAEPLSLRCTAARALDGLDYGGVTGVDPLPIAQKLGALAALACRTEDDRVKEALKATGTRPVSSGAGGLMGGFGGGFPGMEGGDDESGEEEGGYPGSGSGGYPGMDGGSSAADPAEEIDPQIQESRRRLKLPLYCVLLGLRGEPQRSSTLSLPGQPAAGAQVGRNRRVGTGSAKS